MAYETYFVCFRKVTWMDWRLDAATSRGKVIACESKWYRAVSVEDEVLTADEEAEYRESLGKAW